MAGTKDVLRVEDVTRIVREQVLKHFQPGDSLPGDRTLSRQLGVSSVTLSKAMQNLSAEGLIERRPRSGTYMRDRRDELPVALVTGIDILHPAASAYYTRITGHLRNLLHGAGIPQELFIGHSVPGKYRRHHDLPLEFIDAVDKAALRAVILVSVLPDRRWMETLEAANIPAFGINRMYDYGVSSSCGDAIRGAVRHLYAQGRRRFAIITPDENLRVVPSDQPSPLAHFTEVLDELGLEKRDEWIALTGHPGEIGAGWEAMREIWIGNPGEHPEALIVSDEGLFNNVAVALLEMNVDVPNELHVVTHMNAGIQHRLPFPVSRYGIDFTKQCAHLLTMLHTVLKGGKPAQKHVDFPAELNMLEGGVRQRRTQPAKIDDSQNVPIDDMVSNLET